MTTDTKSYIDPRDADDGWTYAPSYPPPDGDARKIVSLEMDGMVWVGVRAFNHATRKWMNNNEPSGERVVAWRDMPEPARGFWSHGRFYLPKKG